MSIVNTVKNAFVDASVYSAKARNRHQLIAMSDRLLADSGFSRTLLEQGVSAWPWRVTEDTVASHRTPVEGIALKPSLAENTVSLTVGGLSSYSDRESADLGIHRERIEAAQRAA